MNSFRVALVLPLFGLLTALAGCSGEAGTSGATETAKTAESVTAQREARGDHGPRHRGPGGPDMLVFAALHEPINLTAEQKTTIEGILSASGPKAPPPVDSARMKTLAAGIRSGNVDPTLAAHPGPSEADRAAHVASSAKALTTLHDTLTKEQRVALVDAVVKRTAERGAKGDHEGKPGDGERGPRGLEGHGGGHSGGMMGAFVKDLDLSTAQKEALKTKLEAAHPKPTAEQHEAMKKQHEALKVELDAKLQTFKNDTFDAVALVTPPARPAGATPGLGKDRMAEELAIVVSVLEPAQREKLAARIEQGPPAREHGPHGPAGKQVRPSAQ